MTPAEYALSVALDPGLIKEAIGARSLRLGKIMNLAGHGVKGVKSDAKVIANIRSNQGVLNAPNEATSALNATKPQGDEILGSRLFHKVVRHQDSYPNATTLRPSVLARQPGYTPDMAAARLKAWNLTQAENRTNDYLAKTVQQQSVRPSLAEVQKRQADLAAIPDAPGFLGGAINKLKGIDPRIDTETVRNAWIDGAALPSNGYLGTFDRMALGHSLANQRNEAVRLAKTTSLPIANRVRPPASTELSPETIRNTLPTPDARYKAFGRAALRAPEQDPIWYSPNADVVSGYAKSESRPFLAVANEATLKKFGPISPVHPHKQTDTRGMVPDQLPPNQPTRSGPIGEAPDYEQVATMPSLSEWLQNNQLYRRHPHNPAELQRLNPRAFGSDAVAPKLERNW